MNEQMFLYGRSEHAKGIAQGVVLGAVLVFLLFVLL